LDKPRGNAKDADCRIVDLTVVDYAEAMHAVVPEIKYTEFPTRVIYCKSRPGSFPDKKRRDFVRALNTMHRILNIPLGKYTIESSLQLSNMRALKVHLRDDWLYETNYSVVDITISPYVNYLPT
jgi:hypothetical protein